MSQSIPCDGPDCSCRDGECTDEACQEKVQKYLNHLTRRYFRFKQ